MNGISQASFVEETVDKWLEQWSGLRLYIRQRRTGSPPDAVMDTLLREVLRLRLGQHGDPGTLAETLVANAATSHSGSEAAAQTASGYTSRDEIQNPSRHAIPTELHPPLV